MSTLSTTSNLRCNHSRFWTLRNLTWSPRKTQSQLQGAPAHLCLPPHSSLSWRNMSVKSCPTAWILETPGTRGSKNLNSSSKQLQHNVFGEGTCWLDQRCKGKDSQSLLRRPPKTLRITTRKITTRFYNLELFFWWGSTSNSWTCPVLSETVNKTEPSVLSQESRLMSPLQILKSAFLITDNQLKI